MKRPAFLGLLILMMVSLGTTTRGAQTQQAPVPPATATAPASASAPTPAVGVKVEKAVVYGQARGKALTMDVFTPTGPIPAAGKGKGVIFLVSGSYKSTPRALQRTTPIFNNIARQYGYTVFAVTHGSQPEFVVSEIVPQITRSVRFIRANAARFGVAPDHLGIIGFSSGGHLALMMGVHGDGGQAGSADPVERTSSRVQSVVAFFPPTDFLNYGAEGRVGLGTGSLRYAFFHAEPSPATAATVVKAEGRALSPIYSVKADEPPMLLIHGDKDPTVPLQQSQRFLAAMKKAGATCELVVKPGGGHGWLFMDGELKTAMGWFDRYLR